MAIEAETAAGLLQDFERAESFGDRSLGAAHVGMAGMLASVLVGIVAQSQSSVPFAETSPIATAAFEVAMASGIAAVVAILASDRAYNAGIRLRGKWALKAFDQAVETAALKSELDGLGSFDKEAAARCVDPKRGVWIVRKAGHDVGEIMTAGQFARFRESVEQDGSPFVLVDYVDDGKSPARTIITRTVNGRLHGDDLQHPALITRQGDETTVMFFRSGTDVTDLVKSTIATPGGSASVIP